MMDDTTTNRMHAAATPGARHRGRRRGGVEGLTAGIYGTVVLASTMVGAEGLSLRGVIVSGLTTVLVYWVAEQYAGALARRALIGRITRADIAHTLRGRFAMVEATFIPLLVVMVAGALGASVSAAVTAGLVVAAGSLAILGGVAARRAGMSVAGTLGAALLAAVFGGVVVLLKLALH